MVLACAFVGLINSGHDAISLTVAGNGRILSQGSQFSVVGFPIPSLHKESYWAITERSRGYHRYCWPGRSQNLQKQFVKIDAGCLGEGLSTYRVQFEINKTLTGYLSLRYAQAIWIHGCCFARSNARDLAWRIVVFVELPYSQLFSWNVYCSQC